MVFIAKVLTRYRFSANNLLEPNALGTLCWVLAFHAETVIRYRLYTNWCLIYGRCALLDPPVFHAEIINSD